MTNFERIKNMNEKELADFISHTIVSCAYEFRESDGECCNCKECVFMCSDRELFAWLQEEAIE